MNTLRVELLHFLQKISLVEGVLYALFFSLLVLILNVVLKIRYERKNEHKRMIELGFGKDVHYSTKLGNSYRKKQDKDRVEFDGRWTSRNVYTLIVFNPRLTLKRLQKDYKDDIEDIFDRSIVMVKERKRSLFRERRIDIYFDAFKPLYTAKDFKKLTSGLVGEDGKQVSINRKKNRTYQIAGRSDSGKTTTARLITSLELEDQMKAFPQFETELHLFSKKKNDVVDMMNSSRYQSFHYSYSALSDLKKGNDLLERILDISEDINKKVDKISFNDKFELVELQKKGIYKDIAIPNLLLFIDESHMMFSLDKPVKPLDLASCPDSIKRRYKEEQDIYNEKVQFKSNLKKVINLSRYLNVFILVISHEGNESENISRNLFHSLIYSKQSSGISTSAFGSDVCTRADLHSGKFVMKYVGLGRDHRIVKAILPDQNLFNRLS